MPPRKRVLPVAGLAAVCLLLTAPGASAQIPETYENLKVLPEEIKRPQLLEVMKGFAIGLGVRCHHCHAGEEGKPLSEFDFASDEKPAKSIARSMMRMVREINDNHIEPLKTGRDARITVSCRTCHDGLALPRSLDAVLAESYEEGGVEAMLARYAGLRERYHGRGSYDFGQMALDDLAMRMTMDGNGKDALALIELHAGSHPGSSHLQAMTGEIWSHLGDRNKAIEFYEKAVKMDPSNRFLQRKLKGLEEKE